MGVIVDKWHADAAVVARLAAPRRITVDHIGGHYQRYPGTNPKLDIPYGVVRNHDWTNAGTNTRWDGIHTSTGPDVYAWTGMDNWVNTHVADGKTLLHCLMGTPDHQVTGSAVIGSPAYGGQTNQPPSAWTGMEAFVTAMVNRYKDRVHYWEGWNEPNLPSFWTGTAAQLAEMQRRFYQAVKAADPTATVLSPCFTSVFSGVSGWAAYLSASDGAGGTGKDWFDVASYHYYCNDGSNRPTGLYRMHEGVVEAMDAVGISRPVWGSEWGLITPTFLSYSADDQRKLLRVYLLAMLVLGIERVVFYAFDDSTLGLSASNVTAWSELLDAVLNRTMTTGLVHVVNQNYMHVRCTFDDGTAIEETWGPMP